MRIDVVDWSLHFFDRHAHAAHRALARGRHHVGAVRRRAVTDKLGIDLGAARLGVVEFFEDENAAAAGDHEAVAVLVIGSAGLLRRLVELGRHRAHRVEQFAERPVELLAAAGEHHVLLAPLDHLGCVADAVRRSRAGRADRVVDALGLEPGGEIGRTGRGHRLGHGEGPDALWARGARRIGGGDDRFGRGAARADDQAGARIGDVFFFEPGIQDRLVHRHPAIAGAVALKAPGPAVDDGVEIDLQAAMNLAAEIHPCVVVGRDDAGLGFAQRGDDFLAVVADGRNDAHPGYDDAAHDCTSLNASVLSFPRKRESRP